MVPRVVLQPILNFVLDPAFTEVSDTYDGCDFRSNVIRVAYGFANDVNGLRGRICVDRAEINIPRVQIVTGGNLDCFLGCAAVADQHHVVSKSSDLDRSPRNAFDDTSVFQSANGDDVSNLERPVSVQ